MRRCSLASLLVIGFLMGSVAVVAAAEEGGKARLFAEISMDNFYARTLFGADEEGYTEEDFYISQMSIQAGARFSPMENVYLDPYVTFEWVMDWGNRAWNDVYWNNMAIWGFGGRVSYEPDLDEGGNAFFWLSDFSLGLNAEYLFNEDGFDSAKDRIPPDEASNIFGAGIHCWVSFDSREISPDVNLWGEYSGQFLYERANYSERKSENYYVFSLDSRMGVQWKPGKIALQAYYRFNTQKDVGNQTYNKEPWLNSIVHGPGIRLSLGELLINETADLYLFTEYSEVDYLSSVEKDSYAGTSDNDLLVGIEIYLPFGATKDRIEKH